MKICLLFLALLLVRVSSIAQSQVDPVTHNKWTSAATMQVPVSDMAAATLGNKIYVIGGATKSQATGIVNTVQIYNPAANTWKLGVSFPNPIIASSAAVVGTTLYVFGGSSDGINATNAVWAYTTAGGWVPKAIMPTARAQSAAVVENGIIYVIGGQQGNTFLSTVESYDPATDSWTTQESMLGAKQRPSAGRIGTTIIAADGATAPTHITGDTEGYNVSTNTWTELTPDPTARVFTCNGAIGTSLYAAGGYLNNGGGAPTLNESFQLAKNAWTALASMPAGTMRGGSAVYQESSTASEA